jgi:hypothetical protein
MRTRSLTPICSLLAVVFFAGRLHGGEPIDIGACLEVQAPALSVGPVAGENPQITLTNKCGKDITAFTVFYFHADGRRAGSQASDIIALLAYGKEILRNGSSLTVLQGGPELLPGATAIAGAAIFEDGTSAGDSETIDHMVDRRRHSYLRDREFLEALKTVGDYAHAQAGLQEKASEARQSGKGWADRLEYLAGRLPKLTQAQWESVKATEIRNLERLMTVYERVLPKEGK